MCAGMVASVSKYDAIDEAEVDRRRLIAPLAQATAAADHVFPEYVFASRT